MFYFDNYTLFTLKQGRWKTEPRKRTFEHEIEEMERARNCTALPETGRHKRHAIRWLRRQTSARAAS